MDKEAPSAQPPASALSRAEQAQASLTRMPASRLGWPGRFVKRLLRRGLRGLVQPQQEFNAAALESLQRAERELGFLLGSETSIIRRVEVIEAAFGRFCEQAGGDIAALREGQAQVGARLGQRLDAVEASLGQLSEEAARDLAALREGHLVATSRLEGLETGLGGVEAGVQALQTLLADLARNQAEATVRQHELSGELSERDAAAHERLEQLATRLDALRHEGEASLGALRNELDSNRERVEKLEAHVPAVLRDVHTELADTRTMQASQGRQLDDVASELIANTSDVRALDDGLQSLKSELRDGLDELEADTEEERRLTNARVRTLERRFEPLTDLDHFDFAKAYRGDETEIRARLAKYARSFGDVEGILDFGCGRGEFLEVCAELGIGAYGFDTDPDMISHCKLKKLEAFQGDALEHLRGMPSRSLDGLFSAQVVEHLTPSEIAELVHLAADKLKRGGRIILETINPGTWSAMRWFYLDPSHIQPVPAEMLRFFLEDANFEVLDVMYSSPVPADERLTMFKNESAIEDPAVAELAQLMHRNWERLNTTLFGPQDYAIIAER